MTDGATMAESNSPDFAAWKQAIEAGLRSATFEKKLTCTLLDGIVVPALSDPAEVSAAPLPTRPDQGVAGRWGIVAELDSTNVAVAARLIPTERSRGADVVALRLGHPDAGPNAANVAGTPITQAADLRSLPAEDRAALRVRGTAGAFLPVAALQASWINGNSPTAPNAERFSADPIGGLARDGRLLGDWPTIDRLLADLARWTAENRPGETSIAVDTTGYANYGASEVQELAIAASTTVAYLRALTEHGLTVDQAASQIAWHLSASDDLHATIAKLRAARQIFARIIGAAGGSEGAQTLRLHATTSRRMLTRRDPWTNLLRATSAAFAASVAGVDTLTVLPFDAAIGRSDDRSRRLARNLQRILAEESHLGRVLDPAAGATAFEALTAEIGQAAWTRFQQYESAGGIRSVLADGSLLAEVDRSHEAAGRAIATRKQPIVGVSQYVQLDAEPLIRKPETGEGEEPSAPARDDATTAAARSALRDAVSSGGAILPAAIRAAQAEVTIAEMQADLGLIGGAESIRIPSHLAVRRSAEPFEALQDAADQATAANGGTRPSVFLAPLGSIAEAAARRGFAQQFAAAGGLDAVGPDRSDSAEEIVAAWSAAGSPPIAIVCGSDDRYAERADSTAAALRDAGCSTIILAGRPGDAEPAQRAAGITGYIHLGCDTLATLRDWAAALGL